jgi:hypothetical protein
MSCGRKRAWRKRVLAALAAALFVALAASTTHVYGQAAWEYSPYKVRVRIALAPQPQLPGQIVDSLGEQLAARSESALGALWELDALAAPPALRDLLVYQLHALDAEVISAAVPEDLSGDKLLLLAVGLQDGAYQVAVREMDCRTRQFSPMVERPAASIADVPRAAWDAAAECFTPLVRIERVDDKRIVARLRAGGLIVDPESRGWVEPGMVLRPIVRRNDRSGEPLKGGLQALPWTLLEVNERSDSLLDCTLHSGYRSPIPVRGGVRTERLALLVRPTFETTTLVLQARSTGKRLAGYELHLKAPGEEESQPIGASDGRGTVALPREEGGLRLLYVRNGRQLLARLPIVFGQEREMVATMVDDDGRLQAEGFVIALQSRALDLVARREILAARIRARIKAGEFSEAQMLLEELNNLERRDELNRSLDTQQRQVATSDRLTQARVERLFADARKLLLSPALGDALVIELSSELTAARTGRQQASVP